MFWTFRVTEDSIRHINLCRNFAAEVWFEVEIYREGLGRWEGKLLYQQAFVNGNFGGGVDSASVYHKG